MFCPRWDSVPIRGRAASVRGRARPRAHRPRHSRHDLEDALPGAEGDVLLEVGGDQVARALRGPQAFLRRSERARDPDRGGGGVGQVAAEPFGDPPRAVGVVDRELALHAGADDGDVLPGLTRRSDDRVEVHEARGEDALAALRRRHERPGSVRRRQDEGFARRRPGTPAASSRGRSPGSGRNAAHRRERPSRDSRAAPPPPRPPSSRAPGDTRWRAPARSSRWPGGRRRRCPSAPRRPRRG